nr:peptidoglycan hydrolase RipC [Mycolicibacterium goodii]
MTLPVIAARSRAMGRRLACLLAAIGVLAALLATDVSADPAADALAELTELSRRAEQTTEQMHTAQIDLDEKLSVQLVAENRAAADRVAVDAASADLAKYQAAVDKLAAAAYMGGRTDTLAAALTATSPQELIEQLAIQKTVASELTVQMAAFRSASARAAAAADRSAKSAAQARNAADEAAVVRTDLEAKQRRMQEQIAAVQARYDALTPDQRAILADPGPPPSALPSPPPVSDPSIVAMPGPAGVGSFGGGTAVVQAALTRVGSPYSWGATGPDAFDCSGLIKWAFLQNGKSLPRSSQALAQGGQPVATSDLQPGDIVTFYDDVSHAGIYIGDGMMVHASTYGTPVKVAPISSAPIHNVRRY